MKFIDWFRSLLGVCTPTEVHNISEKVKEFPKAKRYIIHTAEGGRFCCRGQKAVADTLEALYSCGIDRNRIHNAMMHHKGRIVIDNKYIATVKYKKEK